jgi:hypothetical protein
VDTPEPDPVSVPELDPDPVPVSEVEPALESVEVPESELGADPADPDADVVVVVPEVPWWWWWPPDPRLPPRPVRLPLFDELQVFPTDPAPVVLVFGAMPVGSPTRMCTGAVVVVVLHCEPVDELPDPRLVVLPLWFLEVSVAGCWFEELVPDTEVDPVLELDEDPPPVDLLPEVAATEGVTDAEMAAVVPWCCGGCAEGVERTDAATSDTEPTTTPAKEPAAIPAGTRRRRRRRMA